jgi:tetratricopeptide (TPR) repeat protein
MDVAALEDAARLHAAGKLDEAEQAYQALLAKEPRNPDLLNLYGVLLGQKGNLFDSVRLIGEAIRINPESLPYYWNLAVAKAAGGDVTGALAIYSDLGMLHMENERFEEALAAFTEGARLDPQNAQIATNAGVALGKMHRWDEALVWFDRVLAIHPDFVPAITNRGNALWGKQDSVAGIAEYRRAAEMDPSNPYAQLNYGYAIGQLGKVDDALVYYRKAIDLAPESGRGRYDHALLLLMRQRFKEGFAELDWRWHVDYGYKEPRRTYAQPVWRGEPPDKLGGPLMIMPEQGYGDQLLFSRYLKPLAKQGYEVLVETPPALQRLLAFSLAECRNITVTNRGVVESPVPWLQRMRGRKKRFAAYVGMVSLPARLTPVLGEKLPQPPYLSVPPELVAKWRARVEGINPGTVKVGIVWSGDPRRDDFDANLVNRQRSLKPEQLAILDGLPGVTLVSLQKGPTSSGIKPFLNETKFVDFMDEVGDFADTAALMQCLDMSIAVDTSVANLAGALGIPFWVILRLNSDWRWSDMGDVSPWFPTARMFRQTAYGDWGPVLNELRQALMEFAAQRASGNG